MGNNQGQFSSRSLALLPTVFLLPAVGLVFLGITVTILYLFPDLKGFVLTKWLSDQVGLAWASIALLILSSLATFFWAY